MEKESRLTKSINNLVDLINETEWYKPIAIISCIILAPVIGIIQFIIRFVASTIEEIGNLYEDLRETKNEQR